MDLYVIEYLAESLEAAQSVSFGVNLLIKSRTND